MSHLNGWVPNKKKTLVSYFHIWRMEEVGAKKKERKRKNEQERERKKERKKKEKEKERTRERKKEKINIQRGREVYENRGKVVWGG